MKKSQTGEIPHSLSQFEKVKEITDKLEAGIVSYMESDKFKTFLNCMARFHSYSLNNTLLIAMQKPDATLVAGYTAWQKNFGRQVRKGEKAIRILAPTPYRKKMEVAVIDPATGQARLNPDGTKATELKEIMVPAFKVVNVFDAAQTDGKPLPTLGVNELTGDVRQYEMFFEALKRSSPVPISFEQIDSGAKGYYHTVDHRIALQEGMSQVQTIKTAVHEISHSLMHSKGPKELSPDDPRLTRNVKEVEAEAVAYTVSQHYGIETSDYTFAYILSWSQGKDTSELKASLDRIRQAADELITTIDGHIAELQKEQSWEHLTADDVKNIQCVDSKYYPWMRTAEHTLNCEIHGEPVTLMYEVSQHDDGEGFTIHSEGKDIWEMMPEPELRKLEPVLSQAVTLSHWQRDLDQAETVEAVQNVRYGLYDTENLNLSREQIHALHEAIDQKEASLAAAAVKEQEAVPGLQENSTYRYYSTQRPVAPGTFPKRPDNKVVEIVNFDKRIPVENQTMRAWGYIEFQKPLSEKDASDYELRPAPSNVPDKKSVLKDLKSKQPEPGKSKSKEPVAHRRTRKPKEESR